MKKINEKYFINKDKDYSKQSIESVLLDDEKILWKDKPRLLSFVLSAIFKQLVFVIVFLGFDIVFLTLLFNFVPNIPMPVLIFIIVFFVLHLIPVWIWIYGIVSAFKRQKLEEYAFTDRRIIVKKGFIGSKIDSIYYTSLDSVNLKVGIIEKMCKVGDIYIVSEGKNIVLEDIKDPYFISQRLQAIAMDIKSDIIFPNALRPKENAGYKTKYKGSDWDLQK